MKDFTIPVTYNGKLVGHSDGSGTVKFLSIELQDKILKKGQTISVSSRRVGTCHCGQPVDESNSDCVTFNLCKDCAMDA